MSQFTFLHEINDFVYVIDDCENGSADAIKRGEVIEYEFSAVESASSSTPTFAMAYKIRFDGDTFTTEIEVPFTTLSLISLTEGLDETSYDQVGSPAAVEGSFTAGAGYLAGDVLTLSDGSTITVDTVAPAGSPAVLGTITGFTVTTKGGNVTVGTALTQLANAGTGGSPAGGVGVGFTLTPGSGTVDDDGFFVLETATGSTIFAEKADAVAAYSALLA